MADAAVEVEALNTDSNWCQRPSQDDGHQLDDCSKGSRQRPCTKPTKMRAKSKVSFRVKLFLKLVLKPSNFGVEVRGVFQDDAVTMT